MLNCRNSWKSKIAALCMGLIAFHLSPSSLANQALEPSIVTIYSKTSSGNSSQGTGFFVSDNGQILTAYHVVQDASEIEIYDSDMRRLEKVVVQRIDERRDIALIKVEVSGKTAALRLSASQLSPYVDVRIAGSPRGLPKQILVGKLTSAGFINSLSISSASGKRVFAQGIDVLPIDVTVYGGMSGAPVVDPTGSVIGVLSGSYDEGRGLSWAIPVKYVDAMTKLPAINLVPSATARWPALSLMSTGWISLKRSYTRAFNAIHIARLESLEGAFRGLKGTWRGTVSVNRSIFSSDYFGSCSIVGNLEAVIKIDRVDAEEPRILGSHSTKLVARTSLELGENTQPARKYLYEKCGIRSGQPLQETAVEASGPISLVSKVDSSEPTDRRGFPTEVDVHDCQVGTDRCPADNFGRSNRGRLEIIHSNRIRWQSIILDRVTN